MGRPTERRKGAGVACGRPCLLKTDAAASMISSRPARSRRAGSRSRHRLASNSRLGSAREGAGEAFGQAWSEGSWTPWSLSEV